MQYAGELFKANKPKIGFLQHYYEEMLGKKVKIELSARDTSSCATIDDTIIISVARNNIEKMLWDKPQQAPSLFYTLLEHEIGHAVYTGKLPYTLTLNVLEDNRLEYLTSQWNTMVDFEVFRYLFQDMNMTPELLRNDAYSIDQLIMLGLLRTVFNQGYIDELSVNDRAKDLIRQILKLNDDYRKINIMLSFDPRNMPIFSALGDKLQSLVDELKAEYRNEREKKQEEQKQDDSKSNEQQDNKGDSQSEESEQDKGSQSQDGKEETEQYAEKQKQKLKEKINEKLHNLTEMTKELEEKSEQYIEPLPSHLSVDYSDYHRYPITLENIKRASGIKGIADRQKSQGSAKELNMRRYARRQFVLNEKLFDTHKHNTVRGGKSAKVCFYLDISGSMQGEKIRIATDYLKSFYDSMHKQIDIRMFAFGEFTYSIQRHNLNLMQIIYQLEGSTRLHDIKTLHNEQAIIITDGIITNLRSISDNIKNNAHFVIIKDRKPTDNSKKYDRKLIQKFEKTEQALTEYYSGIPHKTIVEPESLVDSINKATRALARFLS